MVASILAERGVKQGMKPSVEVREIDAGSGRGNLSRRLVLAGPLWNKLDLCAHGQQLRWHCDECDEYFSGREKGPKEGVEKIPQDNGSETEEDGMSEQSERVSIA